MSESNDRRYWIIVGSPDNFERTAALGFTVQGIKSRHRKKAERMEPGDKLVFYLTGKKAFAAVATVESPYFESSEP
ncbi:MAG: EVE domain-containing protein, partial [Thermomicrobiales bacterium]|nr:EVE domain-containing protein [Thermomicrobiales bacterium]